MTSPRNAQKKTRSKRGTLSFKRGLSAEFLCRLFLRLKLYRILSSRCRTPLGEIDIVAAKGKKLAFIEVKARPCEALCAEAVSKEQQKRIIRAARAFLARNPRFGSFDLRFDVMLVAPGAWPLHIVNAFDDSFYPQ